LNEMKFAVQEDKVPGSSLPDKLRRLETYGYDGIELWGRDGLRESIGSIDDWLSTSKVKISTICSGYSGDLLAADRESRERAILGIEERLGWASQLGAVGLITVPTFGGPKLSDLSPLFPSMKELETRLLVEEVKRLSKSAEDKGAYLILEPINRYETHFMNRLEQAVAICREIGSEKVAVMADYFHMNIEESKIEESIGQFSDFIVHLHLADSNRVQPGYGHTDFSSLAVLERKGFKHYGALECSILGNPETELPRTLAYLKKHL